MFVVLMEVEGIAWRAMVVVSVFIFFVCAAEKNMFCAGEMSYSVSQIF